MENPVNNVYPFDDMAGWSGFWSTPGPWGHAVISSRIRFARNMASLPFPNRLSDSEMEPLFNAMEQFARESRFAGNVHCLSMNEIDNNEKRFLRECNIITYEMEVAANGMVCIDPIDDFTILVNEEDHIRIQTILPGLQFQNAYAVADAVDSELNNYIPYAFSPELGYLSACVSNIGTGLRVSALLHLPILTMKNRIVGLIPEEKKAIAELRGTLGQSSKTVGGLYQLSNRVSLGHSEVDIIESVDEILCGIVAQEDTLRDECYAESRLELEDRIWRSFGCLIHARKITYIEAMDHLSNLRLGVILAVLKNIDIGIINDCMVEIQWAHLQRRFGCYFKSTGECDEYRARYLRDTLGSLGVA